jgi:hypothetical protein
MRSALWNRFKGKKAGFQTYKQIHAKKTYKQISGHLSYPHLWTVDFIVWLIEPLEKVHVVLTEFLHSYE